MRKTYEAPKLTLIGQAQKVVMGSGPMGLDNGQQTAPDFEFEQDWPLIYESEWAVGLYLSRLQFMWECEARPAPSGILDLAG
jgi:hypothetical protein